MFGTELDTAYFDNSIQSQPNLKVSQMESPPKIQNIQENKEDPIVSQILQHNSPPSFQNEQLIKDLQKELHQQKLMNAHPKEPKEPLYERYISKKKDVFKLIIIAMTVLLGISLHFVFGDLIRSYLEFNDFTYNKETMIKAAYPLSVFFVIWSLKVFNK
jgi:hypothetical protein